MEKNGRPILHKIKNENNKRVFDYYRKNPSIKNSIIKHLWYLRLQASLLRKSWFTAKIKAVAKIRSMNKNKLKLCYVVKSTLFPRSGWGMGMSCSGKLWSWIYLIRRRWTICIVWISKHALLVRVGIRVYTYDIQYT